MVAAADAASDVRASVVRNLRQVAEKGVVLPGERTDKCLVRTQVDPGQGAVGGRRQRGELLQGGYPVGPGRVRQAQEGLGSTDGADADLRHLLGGSREVLHRAELATGDRKHVDRPAAAARRAARARWRNRTGPYGGTRQVLRTGCRPPTGPAGPTAPPPRRGGGGRRPPPIG